MLKNFFKKDDENGTDTTRERQIAIEGQDEEAQEAMDLLAQENQADLDATLDEISETVREAAKASLRDIKLMEEGRCPSCGHKTNQFLFTTVCASCGWFSFISPEEGKSIIHLKGGSTIECGTTFDTKGGYLLGITNGVVRTKVPQDNVEYVEFSWTDEEVHKKRESRAREEAGICSWCEKALSEVENDENIIVYAAFATHQNRHVFCSEKCNESFQDQYPIRIHKNCYNRTCLDCDLCLKRFSGEDEAILQKIEQGEV